MAILPDTNSSYSLRKPSLKRISTPNAERLTTITEGPGASHAAPAIPPRSSRRNSASHSEANSQRQSHRWSNGGTSTRTGPPPYEWIPEPPPAANSEDEVFVDENLEKLRQERRKDGEEERRWKRGGFVRAVAIGVAVATVVAIALGVGLGVGLQKKASTNSGADGGASNEPYKPPQKFPLGEYSFDTALMSVTTSCTSNPATWRCFPYSVYSADGSTNDTSLAVFNWIITNSSEVYATNTSRPTDGAGIPANLTVSTTNDPFGVMFTGKALTYMSDASNKTSARYTFDFTMPRRVVPSEAITSDNSNAECFFNQTLFTANIYLSTERTIFLGGESETTSPGGYEPWPYAVEIQQSAAGGVDVPNCYRTVNGEVGDRITNGLVQQPSSAECSCEYRNY